MKYIIEQVSPGETKTLQGKSGPFTIHNYGIKIKGNWYNAGFTKDSDVEKMQLIAPGNEAHLVLYEDTYKAKDGTIKKALKFKFPSDIEMALERIGKIETRLDIIEDFLRKKFSK